MLRRRNAQTADKSDVRIAQLEDKIETLLSAMKSIVGSSASSAKLAALLSGGDASSSTPSLTGILADSTSTNSSIGEGPRPATPPYADESLPVSYAPFPLQAEESLNFFRSQMLPCFPFIDLSTVVTATQLHQDRQFLWQAILTVTAFSTQARLVQAEEFKRLLFNSALVKVQSDMDLLLGLLTYLAWSTDAFLGRADLFSRFMMLAISLVYDLRLFKPSQPDVQLMMSMTQGRPDQDVQSLAEETIQGFMEKQRALLAGFVLSSRYLVSSSLAIVAIPDTNIYVSVAFHPTSVARMLSGGRHRWRRQSTLLGRTNLVQQMRCSLSKMRLHLIKQRAAYIREQHDINRAQTATASVTASLPGLLYLKTLRGQLHELESSFPPDVHQKGKWFLP